METLLENDEYEESRSFREAEDEEGEEDEAEEDESGEDEEITSRRQNSMVLHIQKIEKRISFLDRISKMSPRSLHHSRTVLSKLQSLAPRNRDTKILLAKAFITWCDNLPLRDKCNELSKQLQERTEIITTLKESYVRDVLNVKMHIENIYNQLKNSDSLCELQSIPSVDLRSFMEGVINNQSSSQIKDALLKAFLVNPDTMRQWTKNPWDQGQQYKKWKHVETGRPYKPVKEGHCIDLYAPSRHKLFVKYCKACVGVMTIVETWNKDVEAAFKRRIDSQTNEELRQSIRNLNTFICEQGDKIEKLTVENERLKKGPKWFASWQNCVYRESDSQMMIDMYKDNYYRTLNQLNMCIEDKENLEIQKFELKEIIAAERRSYEDTFAKMELRHSSEIATLQNEMSNLRKTIAEREAEMLDSNIAISRYEKSAKDAQAELARMIRIRDQLLTALDEKDKILEEYRNEAVLKIDELTMQLQQATEDVNRLEIEVDGSRDIIYELKQKIKDLETEIQFLQQNEIQKESTIELKTVVEEEDPFALVEKMKSVMGILPRHLRRTISSKIIERGPLEPQVEEVLAEEVFDSGDEIDGFFSSLESGDEEEEGGEEIEDDCDATVREESENQCTLKQVKGEVKAEENVTIAGKDNAQSESYQIVSRLESAEDPLPSIHKTPQDNESKQDLGENNCANLLFTSNIQQTRTESRSDSFNVNEIDVLTKNEEIVEFSGVDLENSVEDNEKLININANKNEVHPAVIQSKTKGNAVNSIIPTAEQFNKPRRTTRRSLSEGASRKMTRSATIRIDKPESRKSVRRGFNDTSRETKLAEEVENANSKSSRKSFRNREPSQRKSIRKSFQSRKSEIDRSSSKFKIETIEEGRDEGLPKKSLSGSIDSVKDYQIGVVNLLEQIAPFLAPKLNLKIVVWSVIFLIKFRKAIDKSDFWAMGALGRREEIKREKKKTFEALTKVTELQRENGELSASKQTLYRQKDDLEQLLYRRDAEISQLRHIKENYTKDMQGFLKDGYRSRIIAQWHRSVADEFVRVLQFLRRRIFLLCCNDVSTSQEQLLKSYQVEFTAIQNTIDLSAEHKMMKLKELRMKYLKEKLKRAAKDVLEFGHSHNHEKPMQPLLLGRYNDFRAFGSKMRNEIQQIQRFKYMISLEFNKLENLWAHKLEKTWSLDDLPKDMLCGTCEGRLKQRVTPPPQPRLEAQQPHKSVTQNLAEERLRMERLRAAFEEEMKVAIERALEDSRRNLQFAEDRIKMLNNEVKHLMNQLNDADFAYKRLMVDKQKIELDLSDAADEVNALTSQNIVLRTAVMDSYRVVSAEEDHLTAQRKLDSMVPTETPPEVCTRGTQITCSVCAIRDHEHNYVHNDNEDSSSEQELVARVESYLKRINIMRSEIPNSSNHKSLVLVDEDVVSNIPEYSDAFKPYRANRPLSARVQLKSLVEDNQKASSKFRQLKNIPKPAFTHAQQQVHTEQEKRNTAMLAAAIQNESLLKRSTSATNTAAYSRQNKWQIRPESAPALKK